MLTLHRSAGFFDVQTEGNAFTSAKTLDVDTLPIDSEAGITQELQLVLQAGFFIEWGLKCSPEVRLSA
jgi:hypothetical protein